MLAAVLAVVAIIGLIVAALLIFRHPLPGTVHLSTSPADASVAIDGKPVVGSSPFMISDVAPSVPHEIVVSKQGYRPWTSRFELQSGRDHAVAGGRARGARVGLRARFRAFGRRRVRRYAQRLAQATPVRVSDLRTGDHQIRLEAEGYAPWESSVHVTPGHWCSTCRPRS